MVNSRERLLWKISKFSPSPSEDGILLKVSIVLMFCSNMPECPAHPGGPSSMSPPDLPPQIASGTTIRDRLRHTFALLAFGIGVVLSMAWAALLAWIFIQLAIELLSCTSCPN